MRDDTYARYKASSVAAREVVDESRALKSLVPFRFSTICEFRVVVAWLLFSWIGYVL